MLVNFTRQDANNVLYYSNNTYSMSLKYANMFLNYNIL